jgi:hypothetical protein
MRLYLCVQNKLKRKGESENRSTRLAHESERLANKTLYMYTNKQDRNVN